ncbi:hypothetical protein ACEPAH_2737 [Sanghuangporus vaninii]
MSIVASITDNWNHKVELVSYPTISYIQRMRENQRKKSKKAKKSRKEKEDAFRGLEHYWYSTWNCVLVALFGPTKTLIPCPQPYVSSAVHNNDEKLIKRWLIPDFTVQRIAETSPLRRSKRTQKLPRRHFNPEGRISQKTVALFEIKPFPDETSDMTICNDLAGACSQLMRQIEHLFTKRSWKNKEKVVVGIWAAGDYWSWRIFKLGDLGIKPASKNIDATYRPPSVSEKSEEIPLSEQGSDDYIGLVPPDRDEQPEADGSNTTSMPTEETKSQISIAGQDADQSQGIDVLHERSDSQPQDAPNTEDSPPIYFVLGTEQSNIELQTMLQAIYDLPDSREFHEK